MALFPLLLLVLRFKKSRKLLEWGAGLLSFLLVQVIRACTIGSILPAGTGGTQVADTFSLGDTFWYALSQIAYVFGINACLLYTSSGQRVLWRGGREEPSCLYEPYPGGPGGVH